ncbi:MAG: AMP-binding protein [Actinomycetes bacterium]
MWDLREVPDALRERYLAEGWWTDDTFASWLEERCSARPDLDFRVWSDLHPWSGTIGDLSRDSLHLAGALAGLGVRPGDVVVYQLPNWAETFTVIRAGFHLGAVVVPIVHFYGAHEVEFILRQSGARALVTVDRFGHVDHLANLAGFRDRLPELEHVVVVRSGTPGPDLPGAVEFSDLLAAGPLTTTPVLDPDAPAMIGYTSGTTSEPKGVIHTHRSLLFEVGQLAALAPDARPVFNASPLAHMTGLLASVLLPIQRGHRMNIADVWDPGQALGAIRSEQISGGAGATIFLTSLLDHPDFTPEHARLIGNAGLGGAPVPAAVAERAEALGITVFRSYGSTEHPSITGCHTDEPTVKRNHTDGRPMLGVEIRLLDLEGDERDVGPGEPGQILSRGPDLCAGYTDPALTARTFDPDGWYRTGDVGVLDADGYLTITDRISDIIIRGGANLSAAEIEEALMTMPAVAECAVVAAPDERTGEHALAVIRVRPGEPTLDLGAVQAHLGSTGLPKQKWVEEIRVVDDFPRTPSGKIRKFVLRDELRRG